VSGVSDPEAHTDSLPAHFGRLRPVRLTRLTCGPVRASPRWRIVLLLPLAPTVSAMASAETKATLSVTATDGMLSLEAVSSSLDRVLTKVGETIQGAGRRRVEPRDELAGAIVDTSLRRVPVIAALRRLLRGWHYVLLSGPAGLDEVRVYVDGTTGYRELTSAHPVKNSGPTPMLLAAWPTDESSGGRSAASDPVRWLRPDAGSGARQRGA